MPERKIALRPTNRGTPPASPLLSPGGWSDAPAFQRALRTKRARVTRYFLPVGQPALGLCRPFRPAVQPAHGAAPRADGGDGGGPERHPLQLRGDERAEDARRRGAARALRALGRAAALRSEERRVGKEG